LQTSDVIPNFFINCIDIWSFCSKDGRKKRYICIGLGEASGECRDGRIIVYHLGKSTSKGIIRLKESVMISTPAPVTALGSIHQYLLAVCGKELYQAKIDSNTRKFISLTRLTLAAYIPTKYRLNCISTIGSTIFLTGRRSPVMVFDFVKSSKEFVHRCTDLTPRDHVYCTAFESDLGPLVLSLQKNGIINLYVYDEYMRRLDYLVSFNTREEFLKLIPANLIPKSPSKLDASQFHIPWAEESNPKVFYGISQNGSLLAINRIPESVYRDLKLLQDIMIQTIPLMLGGSLSSFRKGNDIDSHDVLKNVIDGVFLRQFLNLSFDTKELLISNFNAKRLKQYNQSSMYITDSLIGHSNSRNAHDFETIISRLESNCLPLP
jgi:hypothetical protein